MPQDTMTPEERLETVIRLDVPDRVPVAPMIYYFAARYANITMQQLWFDPSAYALAIDKCFRDLGPWDIYFPIDPTNARSPRGTLFDADLLSTEYGAPGLGLAKRLSIELRR